MSSAAVSPAIRDGPNASPYDTAPSQRPFAVYTGDPDIPAQIPPTRRSAGESASTMIMSRPGAIAPCSTPSTWTVNGSGCVPRTTVSPLPPNVAPPAVRWTTSLTGTAGGHGAGVAPDAVAAAAPMPAAT